MKTIRLFTFLILGAMFAGNISAQSADEIISKYLNAIGGKDKLSKITSVMTEGTLDVMGSQGTLKITTLNGKGMRQDIDIMGSTITTCYGEKEGWSLNPLAGGTSAETMPALQYNAGKDQIFIAGPFINYAEEGGKAELVGKEKIGTIDAYKVKISMPDSTSSFYYFDPQTNFLVQATQETEMQGQMVDNVMTFSDYKDTEGYLMPFKLDMNMAGGQVTMTVTISKVELNKPVDEKVFMKPQ